MRVIGTQRDWSEFELDPVRAWRRSRALDAMLRSTRPPPARQVYRGTFEFFERLDAAQALAAAARVNRE